MHACMHAAVTTLLQEFLRAHTRPLKKKLSGRAYKGALHFGI